MWICELKPELGGLRDQIYTSFKEAYAAGRMKTGERLPSKRALAARLGVSAITVEGAYAQLISEGYVVALPKRGYFVADVFVGAPFVVGSALSSGLKGRYDQGKSDERVEIDLSSGMADPKTFPFATWARILRETITTRERELMTPSPSKGVAPLRAAIAEHLARFRGMSVDPEQIVVGAGSEYLYGLAFQLLGRDKRYALENPGYPKIGQVYGSLGAELSFVDSDSRGMRVVGLAESGANVAHLSPTNQYPTGAVMPISRRYELLAWASDAAERWIVEDDYDSEFRFSGRPIPTLQSVDALGKVVYMNTFSQSISSTIRIGYAVLPETLLDRFDERLSFYSNTVSTFEQHALAEFVRRGCFERLLNKRRLHYARVRTAIAENLKSSALADRCELFERDSGLHFLLKLHTSTPDAELARRMTDAKIRLTPVANFYRDPERAEPKTYLLRYSNLDPEKARIAFDRIARLL